MHPIEFQRASPDDAETLGALHSACWRAAYKGIVPDEFLDGFTPEKRAAFIAHILPTSPNEHYVLKANGEAIGMLAFGPAHDEDLPESVGEVHSLYLLPGFWSKGYGRQAMDFAVERLRGMGFREASLWVLLDNARARRFYARYGFAPDGKEEPITLGKELMEARYRMGL